MLAIVILSSIFQKLKILKPKELIKLQKCILMYKANKSSLPLYIQLNFVQSKEIHTYNTRRKHYLFWPQEWFYNFLPVRSFSFHALYKCICIQMWLTLILYFWMHYEIKYRLSFYKTVFWNGLPRYIKDCKSISKFKKLLNYIKLLRCNKNYTAFKMPVYIFFLHGFGIQYDK